MNKLDYVMMNIAKEMATLSKCVSKQVACVLVKDSRIISTGINGTPPGYKNCCDHFTLGINSGDDREAHHAWSTIHENHAETAAITQCAKNGVSTSGCTAYVTLKPCQTCSKLLISAGVKRIVYCDIYDKAAAYNDQIDDMFLQCNIICEQLV